MDQYPPGKGGGEGVAYGYSTTVVDNFKELGNVYGKDGNEQSCFVRSYYATPILLLNQQRNLKGLIEDLSSFSSICNSIFGNVLGSDHNQCSALVLFCSCHLGNL